MVVWDEGETSHPPSNCHAMVFTTSKYLLFKIKVNLNFFFFGFLPFLGPLPQHMEIPRLEV